MTVSPKQRARLEAAKSASTAQLLFKVARLVNERAIAQIRAAGFPNLRTAHTSVFPHIDLEGTRLTELAERVGISKQAVAQLVDDLEQMGALERVPDPTDGRAKLIRFANMDSEVSLMAGIAVLGEQEIEMREWIGDTRMDQLHRALAELLVHLASE